MRQPPDNEALWEDVKNPVTPEIGLLITDDTTLDKPYAKHMDLFYRQWSGKHHQIVNGVNLETVVWTNNETIIPADFRIYDIDADRKMKNTQIRNNILVFSYILSFVAYQLLVLTEMQNKIKVKIIRKILLKKPLLN